MVRGLNALAVSRFTDNPNSTARRNWRARWESNPRLPNLFGCSIAVELRDCPRSPRMFAQLHGCGSEPSAREGRASANYDGQVVMLTEGLHMAGFEPAPLEIALKLSLAIKLLPPDVEDNQQSAAHRNWGDQPDSHRHKRLHGA